MKNRARGVLCAMSAIRPIELVPLYIPNAIVMNCVGPQYPVPPVAAQQSTAVLPAEGESRATPNMVQTLAASDQPVPSLPTLHMPTPEPVPAVDQVRPEDAGDEAGADFPMPVITEVVSLAADASSAAEWHSNDPGSPGHLASLPVQENRMSESFERGNHRAVSAATASGSSPRVRKSTGDRKYERKLVTFEVGMPATTTVQFPTPAPYVPPQPVYINPLPAFVTSDASKVFILEKTANFSGHRGVSRVMQYAQPDTTAPNVPSGQTCLPQISIPAPTTSRVTDGAAQVSAFPSVATPVQAGTTAPGIRLGQGNCPQGSAHVASTSGVTGGTAQVLGYPSVTAVVRYPQSGTTAPDVPSSQPTQAFPVSACYTAGKPGGKDAVQASPSPLRNCTARPNIISKSATTPSAQGNQPPSQQKEAATAQQSTRNAGLLENILKNGKKKKRLAPPGGKKKGPSQSPAARVYPTQVWTRTLPSGSSSTSNVPPVRHGNGDPGPSTSAGPSANGPAAKEAPAAPVLNIPWVRLVVTSEVVSQLPLADVRNGIEKFLVSQKKPDNVCRDGALHLHWDGKDLGTFQFRDLARRVVPKGSAQDHIVISSSDDEEAAEAAAPKRTAPLPQGEKATGPQPQKPPDARTLLEPEVILRETANAPRANAASLKKQLDPLDVGELLEPEVILEEQPDTQLELSLEESSSSDSEESVQSSIYDPTYSPEEELQDLSDDELSADWDDDTAPKRELRNRRQRGPLSCATVSSTTETPEPQREAEGNNDAAEQTHRSGSAEPAGAALLSDPPEASHRKEGTSQDLESAQLTTPCEPAAAAVPIDAICKPCGVDLVRVNESMLINGSVNLSVVREEELFVKDQGAEVASWARLANALSLLASGDLQM